MREEGLKKKILKKFSKDFIAIDLKNLESIQD
jgi:hypothetical protein